MGGILFGIIALLAVENRICGNVHQLDALALADSRQLSRHVRVDAHGSLGVLLAGIHIGHGGAVQHELRAVLGNQLRENAGLIQVSLNASERRISQGMGMGHTGNFMSFRHIQAEVQSQQTGSACDQDAHG